MVGQGTIFGFFDIVSGGAFSQATIFAMSITPYINSSIILQLLTVAIPKLEQLAKEGEEGRKIIGRYIRYGTVILAFLQATGLYFGLKGAVSNPGIFSYLTITMSFTAGTAFLMWLGEQITEYGIGNGISLLIFGGIVSRAPHGALALYSNLIAGNFGEGFLGYIGVAVVLALFLLVMHFVMVQELKKNTCTICKESGWEKMYGGQALIYLLR